MKGTGNSSLADRRIKPLDGLRAMAVAGVIWVHIWTFFGNRPCYFAGIDWNKSIALAGMGVDLFFVISGFCICLMYERNASVLTGKVGVNDYFHFLAKRWARIAPAFYAVVCFESLLYFLNYAVFPLKSFAAHLFFLNTFIQDNVLSPPFWSLATEWQFYVLVPLIFFTVPAPGIRRIVILISLSVLFRLWLYRQHADDLRLGITVASDKIMYRFAEFGWGILAAKFYLSQKELPRWLCGLRGFALSFMIVAAGRLMMVTVVLKAIGSPAFVLRSLGEPVMTLGFAMMLINLVRSETRFSRLLSAGPVLFFGRISYSMYLWHWLVVAHLCRWWLPRFGESNQSMQLSFIAAIVLTSLVGWLSWTLLERPYFSKHVRKAAAPAGAIDAVGIKKRAPGRRVYPNSL